MGVSEGVCEKSARACGMIDGGGSEQVRVWVWVTRGGLEQVRVWVRVNVCLSSPCFLSLCCV